MEINNNSMVPKWLILGLGGLVIAFTALAVVDKSFEVKQNFKSDKPENTISISAEGKVSSSPDLAVINLGVTTQGSSASTIQDESSKKVNQVVAFVKQQGVADEDIVTSQFSIYPQYDYTSGKNVIRGYQATQTVTVKVRGTNNLGSKTGSILDGATDNGANEISGVYFTVDDPDDLRQEARKQAIAKAKEKAQELADEAGIRLGKVVSISEGGSYGYPTPMYYDKAQLSEAGRGGASVAPDIQTGSQDITQSVTVVFEVK